MGAKGNVENIPIENETQINELQMSVDKGWIEVTEQEKYVVKSPDKLFLKTIEIKTEKPVIIEDEAEKRSIKETAVVCDPFKENRKIEAAEELHISKTAVVCDPEKNDTLKTIWVDDFDDNTVEAKEEVKEEAKEEPKKRGRKKKVEKTERELEEEEKLKTCLAIANMDVDSVVIDPTKEVISDNIEDNDSFIEV
jgi:hypothetical protein